jgi:hypothetical protein
MTTPIIEVGPLPELTLWLRFNDGTLDTVDLSQRIKLEGIFTPLRDTKIFAEVCVDPEWDGICWPTVADLDTLLMHSLVSKQPIRVADKEIWP